MSSFFAQWREALRWGLRALVLVLTLAQVDGASTPTTDTLRDAMVPIRGEASDYDALVTRAAAARLVLLGEDTHGTDEFYRQRARLTLRLIREHGFAGVLLEADAHAVEPLDAYVRGASDVAHAHEAFGAFTRFPRWMWRNTAMRDFVQALREFNATRDATLAPARLIGIDLYGLKASVVAVRHALADAPLAEAQEIDQAYACFAGADLNDYGARVASPGATGCRDAAVHARERLAQVTLDSEAHVRALHHAQTVIAAEAYARAVQHAPEPASWNLRSEHMRDVVADVLARGGKWVVWAHNTHIGDARASGRARIGVINLGQRVREAFPGDTFHIGFVTHSGYVRAATRWGGADRVFTLPPARGDGLSALLARSAPGAAYWLLTSPALDTATAQRALGVIYRREWDRTAHMFAITPSATYDALVFIRRSSAVRPLSEE